MTRQLARSEIETRARAQFGEPNRQLSTRYELRFGRQGSISVELDGNKAGCWFSFERQIGGTLLDKSEMPDLPARSERPRFEHDTDSAGSLRRALNNLQPVHSTPAELYLIRRGITAWPPHSIRFCRAPYGLCGLAQAVDGSIKACQIVYLTDEGRKPAHLAVKKRTYTACTNWHEIAAVRLPGRGEPILCEGIETGLSIWCSFEPRRPVHVCLGMAGFRSLRITSKRLTIARDGDEPGSEADRFFQKALAFRTGYLKQRVKIASPPTGLDFNNVLTRSGSDEIRRIIRG